MTLAFLDSTRRSEEPSGFQGELAPSSSGPLGPWTRQGTPQGRSQCVFCRLPLQDLALCLPLTGIKHTFLKKECKHTYFPWTSLVTGFLNDPALSFHVGEGDTVFYLGPGHEGAGGRHSQLTEQKL